MIDLVVKCYGYMVFFLHHMSSVVNDFSSNIFVGDSVTLKNGDRSSYDCCDTILGSNWRIGSIFSAEKLR